MANKLKTFNATELFIENCMQKKYLIFPNAYLIESELDLFDNIASLNEAIRYWKDLHPLLRCKIYEIYNEDGSLKEKYFGYANDETVWNGHNVEYLRFKGKDSTESWRYLFESELDIKLDTLNSLLWRLKIIHYAFNQETNKYTYWFFLTIHHTISDGRNVYAIILELLSIIQDAYSNNLKNITDEQRKESELEYDYPNDPRVCRSQVNQNNLHKYENIKLPVNIALGNGNVEEDETFVSKNEDGFYNVLNDSLYVSINDLRKQRNSSLTRLELFKIESEKFKALLHKAKINHVKLTSVLCLINSLALKNALKRFTDDNEYPDDIIASIPINTRQFLVAPKLEYRVIGNWMSRLRMQFSCNETQNDEYFKSKFWDEAREQSDLLHRKLSNGDHFKVFDHLTEILSRLYAGFDFIGINTHFTLSNIGDQLSHLPGYEHLKIEEYYSGLSLLPNRFFAQNALATIDNKLFWTLSNCKIESSKEFLDYWISQIKEVFDKVIQ